MNRLIAYFKRQKPQAPVPQVTPHLALGALLVHVAKADDHFVLEELTQIDRILAERFGLKALEAAKMRADCERLERHMTDLGEYAALVRDSVEYEDRLSIVEALWRVVLADGVQKLAEEQMVHLVEHMLGVEAHHSEEARAAAESIR
ncbi:TerB family tellurite resistance protein [Mesobacterium pallidum]|uniref:tellurite resistance TerB family protein n=1 Tax=Mesobacterium pallidum TaxID=2872037 RepID=UPI001EE3541E|nr:TerB family tellurite resistance protein [Mesobacterium pallidum]